MFRIATKAFKIRPSFPSVRKLSTNLGTGKTSILKPALFFGAGSALTFAALNLRSDNTKSVDKDLSSTTKLDDLTEIVYGSPEDFEKAFKEIEEYLGKEYVSFTESDIESHSDTYYQTHHPLPGQRPQMIVFPKDTEEVSGVLKIAHKYRVPIVPYTGGTSLEGQFFALRKGITIDLNRLNRIIEVNEKDLDVTVQAAVSWQDLNEHLAPAGLMFGPDPGPGAGIGGMIGTSCSGTNAARYGTMKENVIGLTVVLADGTIIKTKRRPRKSAAGYNLTGLFIGSEGTLGIVTEATLKLHVKPEQETIAVVNFNSIDDATNSVAEIVSSGIQVNAVELMDKNMMSCVNYVKSTSKTWIEKPTLFIKLGGSNAIINEVVKVVKNITEKNNSVKFEFSETEDQKEELWSARKMALWSIIDWGKRTIHDDIKVYITDAAVPISRLPDVIKETQEDIINSGFKFTLLGHVGDGNFHFLLLYQDHQSKDVQKVVDRLVSRAIANNGTCTGEHGIGVGKRQYLVEELGPDAIDLMRRLKVSLDPQRILNPDKIFKVDPTDCADH